MQYPKLPSLHADVIFKSLVASDEGGLEKGVIASWKPRDMQCYQAFSISRDTILAEKHNENRSQNLYRQTPNLMDYTLDYTKFTIWPQILEWGSF